MIRLKDDVFSYPAAQTASRYHTYLLCRGFPSSK